MSRSTTNVRRRTGVMAILMGLLVGLMVVLAPQAAIAEDPPAPDVVAFEGNPYDGNCSPTQGLGGGWDDLPAFEHDEAWGTFTGAEDATVATATIKAGWSVELCIKQADVFSAWMVSCNAAVDCAATDLTSPGNATSHLAWRSASEDPDPDSASISVGACVFVDGTSTYPATYSLDPGDAEGPFILAADAVEIDTDLAAGTDLDAGAHAPGTVLRIYEDGAEVDLAGATVPDATCEPDPEPDPDPDPATAATVVACEPTGDLGTAVATITNPDGLTVEAELFVTQTDDVGVLVASDSATSDETSFTLSVPVVDGPYTLTVVLDGEVADVVEGTSECETEVLDEVLEPEPEPDPEEPTIVLDEVIENPAPEPVELAATGAPAARTAGAALVAMLLGGLVLATERRRRTD